MKQGWIQVDNQGTQEGLAPKTMADMVYMDDSQSGSVKDAILYHTPIHLLVELPVNGWSATAPHTQTVQVAGLLATDIPLGDVVLNNNTTIAARQLQAYALVSRMDANDGQLKVYCYESKPEEALMIRLKVVR
ncbi:MAG: hypothetical protein VB099_13800 [Candidatus Limiplasma sp.]|nr:hypothetical protein [Candidatus Limiplasma sp.]